MGEEVKLGLPKCAADYIDLVAAKIGFARELTSALEASLEGLSDEQRKADKALSIITQLWAPDRLTDLILKGRKLCRPLWRKAITWALRGVGLCLLCVVAFAICLLLPILHTIDWYSMLFWGLAVCMYLAGRYFLSRRRRRKIFVLAGRVSWASEDIAEKYGAFVIPKIAQDYISLVAGKVGYRRRIRAEVRQELEGHFHDALESIANKQERLDRATAAVNDFGDARLLAKLIRRGKKRCRPLWLKALIRTCQAAGIAILVLITYMGWMFAGRPYISVDYVAELNRMVKPVGDDSLNGEPYYEKAASLLTPEPNDLPRPWQESVTPEQIASGRQWVAANTEAIRQVRMGNEKPYAWRTYHAADGTILGVEFRELAGFKAMSTLVCWQAWLDAQSGDFGRAFDSVKQIYLLGQHTETKGILVEQLVAAAIETRAVGVAQAIIVMPQVNADSLSRFQTEYENLLARTDFCIHYESESMFMKDTVQRTFTKGGRVAPLAMGRFIALTGSYSDFNRDFSVRNTLDTIGVGAYMVFAQPDKAATLRQAADYYDRVQQVASMTPYKARTLNTTLAEYEDRLRRVNYVLRLILPNTDILIAMSWRQYADCYGLVVQIAAERYKRDKGTYPQSLEDLQRAGYLKDLPMDPWSDKPLVYKLTADGYTLYSVGRDFKDDGGKGLDEKGQRIGWFETDKGGDIVIWPKLKGK